jgi:hypothetical protein
MSTENDERYTPEEESYDPEGIAELRRQEEEERLNRRIRREIIRIESGESDEAIEEERQRMEEEEEERKATEERKARRSRSILFNIFTGGFLSTDGATKYYRMLIAIAAMCFICIFLTFLSLNADREYRQREKYASVLHERVVLREEQRYELSSKSAVTNRLKSHGIELIELSKNSRIIEK